MNQILFLSCFAGVFGVCFFFFINSLLPVKLLRLSFVGCLLLLGSYNSIAIWNG